MQERVNAKDISPEKMWEFAHLMYEAFKEDAKKEQNEKNSLIRKEASK